jgi:hypothetical protein
MDPHPQPRITLSLSTFLYNNLFSSLYRDLCLYSYHGIICFLSLKLLTTNTEDPSRLAWAAASVRHKEWRSHTRSLQVVSTGSFISLRLVISVICFFFTLFYFTKWLIIYSQCQPLTTTTTTTYDDGRGRRGGHGLETRQRRRVSSSTGFFFSFSLYCYTNNYLQYHDGLPHHRDHNNVSNDDDDASKRGLPKLPSTSRVPRRRWMDSRRVLSGSSSRTGARASPNLCKQCHIITPSLL